MAEPTRLKIIAQIEGIQGFDALKRSLQGMAQQSQQSGMSLDRLYIATRKLSEQGRNSISSLRLQATALSQLREQAELGSRRFKMLTSDLERVEAQLRRTTQASRAGGGGLAAAGAAGLIGQFAPQLAVGAAVAGVATAGVSAESAQVRLKALTDQFGEYNEAQNAAARIASTLRMNTAEATDSFSQLYASLRPTGITVRELEDTLIGFAAAARNSGASAQETSAAMIQLKQALASGVLQGEELRSIREQAPLAAQAIAREMGVSIGSLKNLAAEGKVTTDVVLRAMQKLKGEQLGKLNVQFETAQQAMTDFGNAAKDAGVELSKLFGPSVIAGLKLLTGAIKSVTNELKYQSQERRIQEEARTQARADKDKRFGLLAFGPQPTAFYNERVKQIEARLRQEAQATPTLTPEQRADQEAARQERLRAGAAAGTGKPEKFQPSSKAQALIAAAKKLGVSPLDLATLIGFETGGSYSPSIVGGAGGNYQGLIQFGPTERAQYGMNRRQTFEEQIQGPVVRYFQDRFAQAGMSTQGADLLRLYTTVLAGSPNANPNARDAFGTSARSGVAAMGGHRQRALQMFFGGKMENVGYSMTEAGANLAQGFEETRNLAKQRAEEQAQFAQQSKQERYDAQQYTKELQLQRDLINATTEDEEIRARYALDYFKIYQDLTKEIEGMVDPTAMIQRINAVDADVWEKYRQVVKDIAQIETERAAARAAETWQESQVTLQATLTDYYQQQNDLLQEQNTIATTLAQSIGQGLSQAFNLAIQGTENWGASLSQIASGVLQDIAQQLIQIAVITPIVNAIGGIGAPRPGSISPGINALPGGDFTKAFNPTVPSFAPGLPAAVFSPGAAFATGGIMTPVGPMPLRRYASGGVATAPQAAIYGEGSMSEAFVPLPDGRRIPVALRQYPGIPGAPGAGQFEQTDAVVQRLVEGARMESSTRAASAAAAGPDSTMRIRIETTRINQVDYVTADQAQAIATAAATRSTARQQRALQASPAARRSVGV